QTPLAFAMIVGPAVLGNWGHLYLGIRRGPGVEPGCRAWLLLLKGEAFALGIGLILSFLLTPAFAREVAIPDGWVTRLTISFVYAQLALFIGIFTQLLFNERPSTAPLPPP